MEGLVTEVGEGIDYLYTIIEVCCHIYIGEVIDKEAQELMLPGLLYVSQDERGDQMIKLLTCQTWVTRRDWFDYAQQHPEQVPFLLVDRSPCADPFLDPYASSEERRPIISGLCRCLKHFQKDDIYIYITKVDPLVCQKLGIQTGSYLGIAALKVNKVHISHAAAAATFTSRRYVVAPVLTSYPPNLAHDPKMPAASLRGNCIVSQKYDSSAVHYTPDCSTDAQWRSQIKFYHNRQKEKQLHVAECSLKQVEGCEALQLYPEYAPVFTPADWGGKQMNVNGIELQATQADKLCHWITRGQ